MREIRFRAWDKESKRMFHIARFDFADNTVYSHLFACEGYLAENLKIMQYTGLKDKNGTEIYEGDVVSVRDFKFSTTHQPVKLIREVAFNHGMYVLSEKGMLDVPISAVLTNDIEVIGNVFQNGGLLNDS